MKSLWNADEAAQCVDHYRAKGIGTDLALRTYSARLLGRNPKLVLHGGGNTSVKTTVKDLFGADVAVLCIKGSGRDLAVIEPDGHPAVRMEPLLKLCQLDALSDEDMVNALRLALLDCQAPTPSIETLLHSNLPHKFVDHTHSFASNVIANQANGEALCQQIYGGRLAWVPYVMPGFDLSRLCQKIMAKHPSCEGMLLQQHGIFSWGETARESYERMIEFVTLAENYVTRHGRLPDTMAPLPPQGAPASKAQIALELRSLFARVSKDHGVAPRWLFNFRSNALCMQVVNGAGLADYARRGVATPEHVIRMKNFPAVLPSAAGLDLSSWRAEAEAAVRRYVDDYHACFQRNNARLGGVKRELDPLPRVLLIPHLGIVGVGRSANEASISADVGEAWAEVTTQAESIGRFEPIGEADAFDMEYWSLEQAKLGKGGAKPLAGQVVLVTGAGSGIGAATARAFASQGAEVALLDRDLAAAEAVAKTLGRHALAVGCDVTDQQSVQSAVDQALARFGGLDIVVSNAGMALGGRMATIDTEVLERSMAVNFYGHQYVAQAAVRVMRSQGLGGCLLFNVSKQAVNPGPDFGAYGTSKAALLALVRQYALEHGADGIRVNAVNADRIRSGLLDDKMIATRSKARGVSEAEYMAGNLLHQEVLAEDVAQAFVASAGLHKTTGNVMTVDGGNVAAMLR